MKKQEERQWFDALAAIFFGSGSAQVIAKIHLAELFQLYSDNLQSDVASAEQENTMPLAVLDAGNDLDAPAIQEALLGQLDEAEAEANNPTLAGAIQSAVTESSAVRDLFHFIQRLHGDNGAENEESLTLDMLDIPRYDWNTPTFFGRVWAAINRLFLWETNEGLQEREHQKQIARYAARLPLSTLNQLPKFVATSDRNVSAADRDSVVQALLARCGKRNLLSDATRESLLETARLRTNIRSSVANNHLCRSALYDYLTSDKTTDLGRLHAFLEKDNAENTILALADKDNRFAILYNLHNQKYPVSGDAYSDSNKASETIDCLNDPKLAPVLKMDLPLVAKQQPEAAIAVMKQANKSGVLDGDAMFSAWLSSRPVFEVALSRTGLSTAIAMREPTIRVYHALAVHQAGEGKAELTALVQKKPGLFEPTWAEQFNNVSPETFKVYFNALSAGSDYASTVAIAQLAIQDGRNTLLNALSGVEWLRWYKKAVTLESGKYLEQVQAFLRDQSNMPSAITKQIQVFFLDSSHSDEANGKRFLLESTQAPFDVHPEAFDVLLGAMDQAEQLAFNAIGSFRVLKQAEAQQSNATAASTSAVSNRLEQLEQELEVAQKARLEAAAALEKTQDGKAESDQRHEEQMAEIQRQRAELQTDIASRQTECEQLTDQLSAAQRAVQSVELRERELLSVRDEQNAVVEGVREELASKQAEHKDLLSSLDKRSQELSVSGARIAELEQGLAQSSTALGEQTAELERLRESLRNAELLAKERQQEAEEKQQKFEAATVAEQKRTQQMVERAKADSGAANQARAKLETKLSCATRAFEEASGKSERLSKEVQGASEQFEQDKEQHQVEMERIQQERLAAEQQLQIKLQTALGAQTESNARADEVVEQVQLHQREIHQLREQLDSVREAHALEQERLQKELDDAMQTVEQAEQRIAAAESDMFGLQAQILLNQTALDDKTSLVERAEAQIASLQQGLLKAEGDVTAKEAAIAAAERVAKVAEQRLQEATEQARRSDAELGLKTTELDETRKAAEKAAQEAELAKEALQNATGDNTALRERAEQAVSASRELSLTLATDEATLTQLNERFQQAGQEKTRLQGELSSAQSKVETQSEQLSILQASLGELREQNARADGANQLLKKDLEQALGEKEEAEAAADHMFEDAGNMVKQMTGALDKLKARLDAEKSEKQQLAQQLEALQTKLSQAEAQRSEAEQSVLASPLMVRTVRTFEHAQFVGTPDSNRGVGAVSPLTGAYNTSVLSTDDDMDDDDMDDDDLFAALNEVAAEGPPAPQPVSSRDSAAVVNDSDDEMSDDDDEMDDDALLAELGAVVAGSKENVKPVQSASVGDNVIGSASSPSPVIDVRKILDELGGGKEADAIAEAARAKYPPINARAPSSGVSDAANAKTLAWLLQHSPRKGSPVSPLRKVSSDNIDTARQKLTY